MPSTSYIFNTSMLFSYLLDELDANGMQYLATQHQIGGNASSLIFLSYIVSATCISNAK